MNKKSFNLYKSWSPMVIHMDPTQAGQLFQAIFIYQVYGEEPKQDSEIYPFFALMKAKFDEDDEAYLEKCEKNKRTAIEREDTKRARTCTNVHERSRSTTRTHQTAPNSTDTDTDTDNDNDKREGEARKRVPFSPPTIEEVRSYCQERKNNVDAEQFVNFYAAKGWMIGKTRMKDWKASVRTWEKRETARSGTTSKPDIIQQNYDIAEIERLLIKN